jgi:hypothetical protein
MAETDRLLASLREELPGAVDASIEAKIWEVVHDACREGWLWRETLTVPLIEDMTTYTPAPAGTEIVHAFGLSHATLDVTDAIFDYGTLALPNAPSAAHVTDGSLYFIVALTPSLDAGDDVEELVPRDMWADHFEMFRAGVLGKMWAQPAKPWSNAALATYHLRDYRGRLALAKRRIDTGGIPGAQRWRFPRWA